ncbi:MAG: hypothetical protein GY818_07055 [Planctomycetaceae bacterium]|nr:hypothetical protein [Planctomycetaceae bacterium]
MPTITYTPTRAIVGGGGSIVSDFSQWDRVTKWIGKEHVSISGVRVSTEQRSDETIRITADVQTESEIAFYREFSESCRNGETFTIDATGIPGAPSGAITYQLKKNSYRESRTGAYIAPSFEAIKV